MSSIPEKKTEQVKFNCTERLHIELMRMAAAQDRTLSDLVNVICSRHVFGHRAPAGGNIEGTECPTLGHE